MPITPRQILPQRYLNLKYKLKMNEIVLENNTMKFIVAYLLLAYYIISDSLNGSSSFLVFSRILPAVTLSIFILLEKVYFVKNKRYAVSVYNIFLLSLMLMAYMNILVVRTPSFESTVAGRTILVLAIVGLEARGSWKSISLLLGIPTIIFFFLVWLVNVPDTIMTALMFSQISSIVILNIVVAEYKNKVHYESFIREETMLFEQEKNRKLIAKLQERNNKIEEQKEEIQSQKEEIASQNEEITSQRDFAERQRDMIVSQKDELTDSIIYAKRIQDAMLPSTSLLEQNTADHMLLFMPKDIVSGDFYWATKIGNMLIFSVADCTGHGVPGGFMSMLGISFLNEIVNRHSQLIPNLILHDLRETVIASLKQKNSGNSHDGMDIALGCIDLENKKLHFSGANNSLILFREGDDDFIELKGDKMPIAIYPRMRDFTLQTIDLIPGDTMYLYSDGFADQFGGPRNKKFMLRNFKNLLTEIHELPMLTQKEVLSTHLKEWMRGHKKDKSAITAQIDDITVLGIRL